MIIREIKFKDWPKILLNSLIKCNPTYLFFKPIIFITEISAIIATFAAFQKHQNDNHFTLSISIILWSTVIISNICESISEYTYLKKSKFSFKRSLILSAKRKLADGTYEKVNFDKLQDGDICLVDKNKLIPADGEVIEGAAIVDESLINGTFGPITKNIEKENNQVYEGSLVNSGQILIQLKKNNKGSLLKLFNNLISKDEKNKSQIDSCINIILSFATIVFLCVILSFYFCGVYYQIKIEFSNFIGLLACLLPSTIAALMNSLKAASLKKLFHKKLLSFDLKGVESALDIDIIFFDKTGTLTENKPVATELTPSLLVSEDEFIEACYFCSHKDSSPEGKAILKHLEQKFPKSLKTPPEHAVIIPFSPYEGLSGIDLIDRKYRIGPIEKILSFCSDHISKDLTYSLQRISEKGGLAYLIASEKKIFGVICLEDQIKAEQKKPLSDISDMGIKTMILSGDNSLRVAQVAKELNIDGYQAEMSAIEKKRFIKQYQDEGYCCAMIGNGINDVMALSQADISMSLKSGHHLAKKFSFLIDLDSNPQKVHELIKIAKQMMVTKGSILTFTIFTDISKYFLTLPAMIAYYIEWLRPFHIFTVHSFKSMILSLLIFNALIILILMPLTLKGINIKNTSKEQAFYKNFAIYGMIGFFTPFIFVQFFDFIIYKYFIG